MRMLIFTHNYPISLSERANAGIFVHDIASQLAKTNSVSVICPASFTRKVKFEGVTVHFFSWAQNRHLGKLKFYKPLDLFYGLSLFFRGIKTLQAAVKEEKPDFVLAMWAIPAGIFAYIAKTAFGIPYAVWVLGSDFYVYGRVPIVGFFIRQALKNAKYTFADGISLADEVSKITKRKCLFLPSSTNFVLPTQKQTKKVKRQLVLTFIGRMEPVKGPDLLLDAVLRLQGKLPSLRVNFIGDGSLLPSLKTKAKREGVRGLRFYGNIHQKTQIMNILQKSDWLVIPSRSDSIPLVFSEAAKAEVPVIAAALPDLKYFINKYEVGVYFKPGNTRSLSSVIYQFANDSNHRRIFAKNTKRVAKIFSVEESAKKLTGVIKPVSKNGKR